MEISGYKIENRTPTPSFTQRSRSRSLTPWVSGDSKVSNSSKVKESDFSPKTHRLAIASKAHVRTTTLYNAEGPFPPTSRLKHMDFAWSTIKETSNNSGDPIIQDAFDSATNDEGTKKRLMQFVSDVSIVLCLLTYITSSDYIWKICTHQQYHYQNSWKSQRLLWHKWNFG